MHDTSRTFRSKSGTLGFQGDYSFCLTDPNAIDDGEAHADVVLLQVTMNSSQIGGVVCVNSIDTLGPGCKDVIQGSIYRAYMERMLYTIYGLRSQKGGFMTLQRDTNDSVLPTKWVVETHACKQNTIYR